MRQFRISGVAMITIAATSLCFGAVAGRAQTAPSDYELALIPDTPAAQGGLKSCLSRYSANVDNIIACAKTIAGFVGYHDNKSFAKNAYQRFNCKPVQAWRVAYQQIDLGLCEAAKLPHK
jgi:hypothetical protein